MSYSWSNGASAQSITVNVDQTYTVTVTDANGCTATDNFSVNGCECEECTYTLIESTASTTGCQIGTAITSCPDCDDVLQLTIDYELIVDCDVSGVTTTFFSTEIERQTPFRLQLACSDILNQGSVDMVSGTYNVPSNVTDCAGAVSYTHLTLPTKRIV